MNLLRWLVAVLLTTGLIGCGTRATKAETSVAPAIQKPVAEVQKAPPSLTVGSDVIGEIINVNPAGRFVVLSFPVGVMPTNGTTLAVYRQGVKSAEIRVTGPQRDTFTVADVLKGECLAGDEARGW